MTIDELIERLIERNHGPDVVDAIGAIERLRAEVDRLRKDAQRYRWLRGGPEIPPHSTRWPRWEVRYWDGRYWQTLFSDALDTAIDAEISNEQDWAEKRADDDY